MKDFLKFTLATVTGIILSSIVLFIVSMVTLFGIHVCFGYGDNSKKEFGNDARSERNVGRTHARESIGHSITIIQ